MIDLHMHSTCSDGSDDVETLINNVAKANIKCFSLTDHDTAEGNRIIFSSEKLKNAIKQNNMVFIPGVEFSCIYNGLKMHILAYGFDPNDRVVFEIENEMKNLQKQRSDFRINYLENQGYKLSQKSKDFLSSRINIRTLDLANCLVNDGYFDDLQVAIRSCIKQIPAPSDRNDAISVLKRMTSIGAKMVWAHSYHGIGEKPLDFDVIEDTAKQLKQYGLVGLECFYSLYNKEEIEKLVDIAKRNNLIITGGSDYHGANKTVKLAETSADGTDMDVGLVARYDIFNNIIR